MDVKPFSKDEAAAAMDYVVKKTDENIADFTDCFPSSASKELMYKKTENIDKWIFHRFVMALLRIYRKS